MHIKTRNVATAFETLVGVFHTGEYYGDCGWYLSGDKAPVTRSSSRNGGVLVIDEPVTVSYSHPLERVLLNPVRDANPFFHLYEALWMLAGRNEVASVAHYAKQMKEYSDDGRTLNGAYGYRWRSAYGYGSNVTTRVDQLQRLIPHLKANPASRRAVLSMWNVEDDLMKVDSSKDVCCNLSVVFSLRETGYTDMTFREERSNPLVPIPGTVQIQKRYYLDMTVTNRSNDLLWGMLGANYVHFTFLQEYMAAHLGAEVGRYHHFTNNLHVYADRPDWRPAELLDVAQAGLYESRLLYEFPRVPLVNDPVAFDSQLPWFVSAFDGTDRDPPTEPTPVGDGGEEPFLTTVARPMMIAHYWHRKRNGARALRWADTVVDPHWRVAATAWLARRYKGVQTV